DLKTSANKKLLNDQRTAKLADITYRYLESSLPVIIGTWDHALVAIGHTCEPQVNKIKASIQRIPDFFVNNDNTGPYVKMPIFKKGTSGGGLTFEDVQSVIAILPREVTLRGEEAEGMAATYINELLAFKVGSPPITIREWLENYRPEFAQLFNILEYRTYLRPSIQYQKDLKLEKRTGALPAKLADELRILDYPKYVWITEFSSPTLLNHTDKKDRKCLGRVIVDPTSPANTKGVIVAHFADMLYVENREEGIHTRKIFPHSTPFFHLLI
ncbi:MAG: hypothetical protein JXR40_02915, partial [Pontiellaceae bacterium]|nr:hypothetical protein [Pontiellaceae bacterium]